MGTSSQAKPTAPKSAATTKEIPTGKEKGQKKSPGQNGQPSPWGALRRALAARVREEQSELRDKLKPFLPDLVLSYTENAGYLEEKFTRIRKLDPDIGTAVLPLLLPKREDRARRQLAENALRILNGLDLSSYRDGLLEDLDKRSPEARMRVLYLLAPLRPAGWKKQFAEWLPLTSEPQLPRLLESIGRFGDPSLAPLLLPILERPKLAQVLAAARALALLRSHEALPKLLTIAKKRGDPSLFAALLELVEGCGNAIDPASLAPTIEGLLGQSGQLSREEVLRSIALTARGKDGGFGAREDAVKAALRPLLLHAWQPIQFASAKALQSLGDRNGIKSVLDRLTGFVKSNRKIPYVYAQRAKAYDAFGRSREALRDIRDAIKYSGKGRVSPELYFFGARLETQRGNASQVYSFLKAADPTKAELQKFRAAQPAIEKLIAKHRLLRQLFGG